jgi:hypothetical protein
MIYEVRTYDLQPHSLPEVEKRFAEAYEQRKKFSQLAAFFHTEIGPLNQIIHIWPYKDIEERNRIRDTAVKEGAGIWPPKTAEFMVRQRSEIFLPFSFSPEMKPGKQGPIFEMRTYTVANGGEMTKMEAMWAAALPDRLKIGPVTAVWKSELGGLNQFLHIWPYKSLNDRVETRNKASAAGVWPPTVIAKKLGLPNAKLVHQENKIVMPSAFSPLQ